MEYKKSFKQTMQEALSNEPQDVQNMVREKEKWVVGNTVSSLVEDVSVTPIGGSTRDILLLLKMSKLFEILEQQKILKRDEVDELNAYLLQLNRVYTERPEPE
jgi:hypothetical protein